MTEDKVEKAANIQEALTKLLKRNPGNNAILKAIKLYKKDNYQFKEIMDRYNESYGGVADLRVNFLQAACGFIMASADEMKFMITAGTGQGKSRHIAFILFCLYEFADK